MTASALLLLRRPSALVRVSDSLRCRAYKAHHRCTLSTPDRSPLRACDRVRPALGQGGNRSTSSHATRSWLPLLPGVPQALKPYSRVVSLAGNARSRSRSPSPLRVTFPNTGPGDCAGAPSAWIGAIDSPSARPLLAENRLRAIAEDIDLLNAWRLARHAPVQCWRGGRRAEARRVRAAAARSA
jgi:hypothetical protein